MAKKLFFQIFLKKILVDQTFKTYLKDLIAYSKNKFKRDLENEDIAGAFVVRKYSRSDVLRFLRWEKDQPLECRWIRDIARKTNMPNFVTYHKDEEISDSIKYEDAFVNRFEMKWYTKSNRTMDSPDVKFFHDSTESISFSYLSKKETMKGLSSIS